MVGLNLLFIAVAIVIITKLFRREKTLYISREAIYPYLPLIKDYDMDEVILLTNKVKFKSVAPEIKIPTPTLKETL